MTFKERFQKREVATNHCEGMEREQIASILSELQLISKKYSQFRVRNKFVRNQLIHVFESATKVIQQNEDVAKLYIHNTYIYREQLYREIESVLDQCLMQHDFEMITVGCHFMYHAFDKKYLEDYKLNIDLSQSLSGMPRADIFH